MPNASLKADKQFINQYFVERDEKLFTLAEFSSFFFSRVIIERTPQSVILREGGYYAQKSEPLSSE